MNPGFRLYKGDETPLYVQAADALRARIVDGEYRPGDRLPSVRGLSDELGVNPATVVAAYRILSSEGLVESRAGSGAYVSAAVGLSERRGTDPASIGAAEPFPPVDAGPGATEPSRRPAVVDLSSNAPPRSLYPLDDLKRFLVDAVDLDEGRAFDYQGPAGYAPLREALARKLAADGLPGVDPLDIHVTSGAQQGLDLVARLLLRRGDVAAVESPGYRGAYDAFLAAGARVAPIPLTSDGLDLDELERLAASRPLRLVYVNPSYHNPTGLVYRAAARERLAAMAARHGFYVLEDDQASELYHDAPPPPPVRSFDRDGRVAYVRSFSKTLLPGLRIACLEAPPAFRERIETAKRSVDLSTSGLMQRVLERFLSSGRYDERLPALRARYRDSARCFVAALRTALGAEVDDRDSGDAGDAGGSGYAGLSWRAPEGGLNLWLGLPEGVGATSLAARLAEAGYAVAAEASFRREPGAPADGHLRLSVGSVEPGDLEGAARAVARLVTAES